MKKIALITDAWRDYFMYAWPHGILQKLPKYKEDVALYHYSSHGNWSSEKLYNQGEYNIYNLPDLKQFDGIIFECNNIVDRDIIEHVLDLIRDSEVPAISVGQVFDGLYYVGGEEFEPIETLIKHMYEEHGCRSFVYAGGCKEHFGNQCRVAAYTSCMVQYGLSIEDNPVIYGDFDFSSGENFFATFMNSGRKLPDVFICACDNVAAGLCTRAELMGYKVPEDFRVTGFDNLDKAAYFEPQITTVDHDRGAITKRTAEVLIDIWNGKEVGRYNYVDAKCIFAESCGCLNNGLVDYRRYMKDQIIYGAWKEKEEARISELESSMSTYTEYQDLYECMGEFLSVSDCDGFFVIVDEALMDAEGRAKMPEMGYHHECLKVVYARVGENKLAFDSVQDLNLYLEKTGKHNHYIFTPIHFKQYAVGYSILKNGRFLYSNPNYFHLHNILVKALEALYMKNKLETANKKLKDIYNKDQLTGIYNRIAFPEIIAPAFEQYYNQGIVCAVGFVDVDQFKQINDTYGHEYGDEVLKKVAGILQDKCPAYGYVCRYGGDEFILFFPYADEKSVVAVKEAINRATEEIKVRLSIGMVLSSDDYGSNISDYFEVADKYMYEEKQKHRNANE